MKIDFEDGGYVDVQRSKTPGKIWISVASKKQENSKHLVVNSAELSLPEFLELLKSIIGPIDYSKLMDQ